MRSEAELISGCARNEPGAQKALYDRFAGRMLVVCLRYARSQQEAEDALQEGFIKVFQAIKDFRGDSQLATWITRVMINTSLNAQRKKLYMLPMVDVEKVTLPESEEVHLAGIHLDELIAMVQSLPDGCRVVFNLFAVEGYGHKEIAAMLGISEGTSKSQYNRAKQLLRARLEKIEKDTRPYGKATF
jgi:RNA polymerase sigma-70 factor (ECF subfamily)